MGRRVKDPPISWLMQLTLSQPDLVSLAAGFTDQATLPVRIAGELTEAVFRHKTRGAAALQYGSTQGDPRLRSLTAAHVADQDHSSDTAQSPPTRSSVDRSADSTRTLITNGSQQLLYLVAEALLDPGDIVLVEDPTYFVYLGITDSLGVRCRGVRTDEEGMDIDHLQEVLEQLDRAGELSRVKLLYAVTYHQNPAGTTTGLERKRRILHLLRRWESRAGHRIYCLEDAAYRELRFAGPDTPSTLTIPGAADRVIYAGTYSKPFATGLRVGFGIVPKTLFKVLFRLKSNHDFGTSNLLQILIADAIESGQYVKNLERLRRRYASKAATMRRACRAHFPPSIAWNEPAGGLYFWARVASGKSTGLRSRLFEAALAEKVLYVPGALCYAADPARRRPDSDMRLSFGGAPENRITEGIRRLGRVLERFGRA